MAKLLPTTRFQAALGPMKVEVLEFTGSVTTSTGTTQTGISTGDTFDTHMVRPTQIFPQWDSNGGDGSTTSISGKTVTFTNTGVTNQTVRFLIFGF
jgi:hypothetical protein